MKKKLIVVGFVLVGLVISNVGIGQSSTLLVTPDKQWNILESSFGISVGMSRIKFDSVVTILDSKEYYELLVAYDPFEEEWQPVGKYFHQDNQKVYTYNEFLDSSLLVFDFSLEVNDTFTSSMGQDYKVVMTDSITLMNGVKAKSIHFECDEFWIEGWGSNYVGLEEAEYLCYFDLSDLVTCTYESGELRLMVGDSCWYYQRTVDVEDHEKISFTIYPNPTSGQLLIDGLKNAEAKYKIYNLNGQVVKEDEVGKTIDVSILKEGVYIIELRIGDQRIVRRFVKRK